MKEILDHDSSIGFYGLSCIGNVLFKEYEVFIEVNRISAMTIEQLEHVSGLYCYEMYNVQRPEHKTATDNWIRIVFTSKDKR